MDYINNIVSNFGAKMPDYLTTLLVHNGFDNVYSLSQFNIDIDVEKMESYARDVLSEVLEGDEKKAIFGIFSNKCSLFKIPEGHKKLLILIKEESEQKIKNLKRPSESSGENLPKKRQKNEQKMIQPVAALDTPELTPSQHSQTELSVQNAAVEHIKNISRNYMDAFSREEFRNGSIDQDKLNEVLNKSKHLNVTLNDEFSATVSCPLCFFISSAYKVKNSKSGRKWVVSNFLRHYRTHFKTKVNKKSNINKEQSKAASCSMLNFVTRNSNSVVPTLSALDTHQDGIVSEGSSNLESNCETSVKIIEINNNLQNANNVDVDVEFDSTLDSTLLLSHNSPQSDEPFFSNGSVVEVNTNTINNESDKLKPPKSKVPFGSRREKSLRLFDELPYNQLQITSFLNPLNDAIDKNPEVTNNFKKLTENKTINKLNFETKGLLKHLLESAIVNSKKKSSNANKFDEGVKRFWMYIFITAGRMTYEVLYANLKNVLPSITTINRQLEEMNSLVEGVVRLEELKSYLEKRNYPLVICISEDQTALIKKVQYDPSTNEMVGFVAPLDSATGFPQINKFPANTLYDIETAFKKETLAINAYVFMAQPIVDGSPAFCLCVFGSDNRFTSEDVTKRWQHLYKEAAKHGITVLGFSSDGDTRCLKSMKIIQKLPFNSGNSSENLSENPYSPYFQAKYDLEIPTVFQDTIHISTKLKTRLLNENVSMIMGNKQVSADHIRNVIKKHSRDKHMLCESFLESSDKMNFKAIDKMSSELVTNLLKEIPEADATRQYLILTRYILDSFLLKELSVEKRIYLIWYTNFFMRLWRCWLKKNCHNLQKNFITLNAYTCIEINAHGIILLTEKLRERESPEAFLPWLYSSQPCEKIFRETRSMSSTFSTMVNYTLLDILRRLKRIQAMHEISTDLGNDFRFPREETKRLGNDALALTLTELPSTKVIKEIIENARKDAILSAREIGMDMNMDCCLNADLPEVHCNDPEEEELLEEHQEIISDSIPEQQRELPEELPKEDREFLEYTSTFSTYDTLVLKDYSSNVSGQKTCLVVTLKNGKNLMIKKSTLIWFFQERHGRLSTDRLMRVKGMTFKKHTHKIRRRNQTKKKEMETKSNTQESTSESESEISLADETSGEILGEAITEEFSDSDSGHDRNNKISIQLELYYAIYYDTQWYIGRVIGCESQKFKIKFLQKDLDTFKWPKKDDIQEVHKDFIFYGPLTLTGSDPFTLRRYDLVQIKKKYKALKH